MEKTREARRSTTMAAASNGVTKRRQRISQTSRGQIRTEKKERDLESMNRSKRRRSERFVRDFGEEEEEEDNNSSSEDDFQYRRKNRIPRHASASLKIADEMIGVPIPRKARSACMKRSSHDCRTSSGSGGFGEDRRRLPASPGSYSFEVASPSSSTVNGSKYRIPKPPKPFGTIEDDLEIEIAEVLSGLKKQTHSSSKREDDSENSLKSLEVKATKKLKTEGLISCKAGGDSANNEQQSTENPEKSVSLIPETQDLYVSKGVSESPLLENKRDEIIDLMVPYSPERVSLLPLVSDPIVTEGYCKLVKSKEEIVAKNENNQEEVKLRNVEKREWLNLDLERPSQETARDSIPRLQNFDWSYQPQQATSAISGWPSVLPPPHGCISLIQTNKPIGENNGSSTLMQVAPFTTSQPRPKRCATHLFIARNIQLHQHFLKTNNHLSQQNKASTVYLKSVDEIKPATTGNPSSPILSLNSEAQDRRTVALNNISAPQESSSSFTITRLKKSQPPPPPPPPPPPASNTTIVQDFIFPTKSSYRPTKNPCVAVGSASVNFSHHEASSSSPYFTVIPNNAYAFQRSGSPSQATTPFFYSPQMFQRQLQQKPRETKPSSCSSSSSSHRQPQPQPQPQPQATHRQQLPQKSETKAGTAGDDNNSQKVGGSSYTQIISGPVLSFASPPANLNFSSSNGYHIVSAPTSILHPKSHDSKTGGSNNNPDIHPKKTLPAIMAMNGQTLVFDNPPRTLNFVSGTWPLPPPATKTHDSLPVTSSSSQWKYNSHPVTSSASLTSCNSLNLNNNKQQIIRTQHHGETQISFATPSTKSQMRSSGSSSKVTNKPSITTQPQQDHQTETSTPGSNQNQKSSPVCGRTVPPIITSHPGHHHHLSELKY